MTDEQWTRVKGYVEKLNTTITGSDELLKLVADTVVDRVLLYLNETALDQKLERIVAQIVVQVFTQTKANQTSTGADRSISSVSDNGQSVSYRNEVQNYLATVEDGELFGGFAKLLAPYRRVHVSSS